MKKKNVLMLIIILLLLLLITTVMMLNLLKKNSIQATKENKIIIDNKIDKTLKNIYNRNDYYIVQNCVNKFYLYNALMYDDSESMLSKEEAENQKKSIGKELYNMLDTEYTELKNITKENISSKLSKINSSKVYITKMYESEQSESLSIYFVFGELRDKKTNNLSDFSMMIKQDRNNKTFSILLEDYIKEKYNDIKVGEIVEIDNFVKIEANESNKYIYKSIDEETYINDMFNSIRDNMLYNPQVAYERLDEEYKSKRFPTFEMFKKYIDDNFSEIVTMQLTKYEKKTYDDSVQYICLNSKNKYYIINEISTRNYKIILDTYTIDLPEFLKKYNSSEDTDKVALNIEKIKEAIDCKDYQYVYNKLDDTFKNNKFQNYTNFEIYLKSNLFEENTFEYKNIEKQANVYVATLTIKNKKDANAEAKKMNIIMKLTDTTDYYMSFSFEK